MTKASAADHLAVKNLMRALKRLQPAQSPKTRRAARRSFAARLAVLGRAVDEDYPLIDEKRGPKRGSMPAVAWQHRAAGYARAAGYRTVQAHRPEATGTLVYVPQWCVDLAQLTLGVGASLDGLVNAMKLREARLQPKTRASLIASVRLVIEGGAP